MMTASLSPQLCVGLAEEGWNLDEIKAHGLLIGSRYGNKKHRHLYLEIRGPGKVSLYIHVSVRSTDIKLKAQTISADKPGWRKSLTRWVSLACLALQERWASEDEAKALEATKERRRLEMITSLVEPTGISTEEFLRFAEPSWEWASDEEIRTQPPVLNGLRVERFFDPKKTLAWNPPTKVAKAARLLTFLEQEGWR